jgi:hydrogenase assembly chaperone HypC/HupF
MCLAIPAKVVSIHNTHAWVETMGVRQKINIQLVTPPKPGEYVLIHAGFAIEKIDSEYFNFLSDALCEMLEEERNER